MTRKILFYNLDVIISFGYRVNFLRATQFRRWATNILKTFTIQGYVLDKERMKNSSFLNKDYFEKLLEEIREISCLKEEKALLEFEKYRIIQDKNFESDFDKFLINANQDNN